MTSEQADWVTVTHFREMAINDDKDLGLRKAFQAERQKIGAAWEGQCGWKL